MVNIIKNNLNWKFIVILAIVTIGFYIFTGLFSSYLFKSSSILETKPVLNSQFNYTPKKAYDLLNSYSEREKQILKVFTYPCDFIIALLYGTLLYSILITIYKKLVKEKYLIFFIVPFVAVGSNIIENILILCMLSNIQSVKQLASITNIFTMSKLIILQISIFLILTGLIINVIKKIIKKNFRR